MEKKDSIETKIILNLKEEYNLFTQKSEKSLILEWFRIHEVSTPVESTNTFKYNVIFLGAREDPKYSGLGIIIYPTSTPFKKAFIGKFKKGMRHGVGWRLLNNELFIGKYSNDKKHGKAIVFQLKGEERIQIFDGKYSNGEHNGDCFIKDKDHIFDGIVSQGLYHGICKISYTNGDYFEGTMVKGFISGKGKIKYANGDIYDGGFLKNKRSGEGTYIFKDDEKSMINQSKVSLQQITSIREINKNRENFIKQHNNPDKSSSNNNFVNKSGLYTDWSYSAKRPEDELN